MSDDIDIPGPADKFYAHLDGCETCQINMKFSFCDIGIELLFEAGEAIDEEWHDVMRFYHQKAINEKIAEMNFAFYDRQE